MYAVMCTMVWKLHKPKLPLKSGAGPRTGHCAHARGLTSMEFQTHWAVGMETLWIVCRLKPFVVCTILMWKQWRYVKLIAYYYWLIWSDIQLLWTNKTKSKFAIFEHFEFIWFGVQTLWMIPAQELPPPHACRLAGVFLAAVWSRGCFPPRTWDGSEWWVQDWGFFWLLGNARMVMITPSFETSK